MNLALAALPPGRLLGPDRQHAPVPRLLAARRCGHQLDVRPGRPARPRLTGPRLLPDLAAAGRALHPRAASSIRRLRAGPVGVSATTCAARATSRSPRRCFRRSAVRWDWLQKARAADPLGLLPPSTPRDNELVAGHLVGDNLWGVARRPGGGGRSPARAAISRWRTSGRPRPLRTRQPSMRRSARRPRPTAARSRRRSTRRAARIGATSGLSIPPVSTTPPMRPSSARCATRALASRRGSPPTSDGRLLHDYLGFRVFETDLAAGDQAHVVDGALLGARPHDGHPRWVRDRRAGLRLARRRRQHDPARLVRGRVRDVAAKHARTRAPGRGHRTDVGAVAPMAQAGRRGIGFTTRPRPLGTSRSRCALPTPAPGWSGTRTSPTAPRCTGRCPRSSTTSRPTASRRTGARSCCRRARAA